MKLRVLSLFSGIGAFEKALKNIGIEVDLVGFSEIDKYAIKSYCAIHGVDESLNLGDVVTLANNDELLKSLKDKNIDLLTHGSPCTTFSASGKQTGGDEGSGTPSSLMWYSVNIIKKVKPKIIIWENVKNVLSSRHVHNFNKYLDTLSEAGYNNYYKVLNAKDYNVPQNRERIFVVSIRRDIGDKIFHFPEKEELKLRLKDVLEDEKAIDKKYYLNDVQLSRVSKTSHRLIQVGAKAEGAAIRGRYNSDGKVEQQLELNGQEISNAITTVNKDSMVIVVGNYMPSGHEAGRVVSDEGCAPTVKENHGTVTAVQIQENTRVRKLTPRECFRLMSFDDEDYDAAVKAGNSIVVKVLEKIFKQLLLSFKGGDV